MFLYHATVVNNVDSIKAQGLQTNMPSNWDEMYTKEHIYLAFNPEVAISYVESMESYDDEDIAVFKIDATSLDLDEISYDWNNKCEYFSDINSIAYDKPIEPNQLHLMDEQEIRDSEYTEFPELRFIDEKSYEIWDKICDIFENEVETNKEIDKEL